MRAFAGGALECRLARFGGEVGDRPAFLHRALAVNSRGDRDRALAAADGVHRLLQAGEAAPGLDNGERLRRRLREHGGHRDRRYCQRGKRAYGQNRRASRQAAGEAFHYARAKRKGLTRR